MNSSSHICLTVNGSLSCVPLMPTHDPNILYALFGRALPQGLLRRSHNLGLIQNSSSSFLTKKRLQTVPPIKRFGRAPPKKPEPREEPYQMGTTISQT